MSVLTLRLLRLFLLLALARLLVRDPIQRLVRNSDIHAFRLESGQKDVQSSGEHWLEFLIAWHADNAGALFVLSLSLDSRGIADRNGRRHVCKFISCRRPCLPFRILACKFFNDSFLPFPITIHLVCNLFRRVNRYEIRIVWKIVEIKNYRYFDKAALLACLPVE